MNLVEDRLPHTDRIVELVRFKWMMAHEGLRVDLPRLQSDIRYGGECVLRGLASESPEVRQCSQQVLGLLNS